MGKTTLHSHAVPRQAPRTNESHPQEELAQYLQNAWSQMSETPRNSSNGGAGLDPGGSTELYDVLTSSYLHRC